MGNGECWTLAANELEAVAERCRLRAEPPVLPSRETVHGSYIFVHSMPSTAKTAASPHAAGVVEEDILDLRNVHFLRVFTSGSSKIASERIMETAKPTALFTGARDNVMHAL